MILLKEPTVIIEYSESELRRLYNIVKYVNQICETEEHAHMAELFGELATAPILDKITDALSECIRK